MNFKNILIVAKLQFFLLKKWASGLLIALVLMVSLQNCYRVNQCKSRDTEILSDYQSLLPERADSLLDHVVVPFGFYAPGSKVRLRGMDNAIVGHAVYIVNGDTVSLNTNGGFITLNGNANSVKFEYAPPIGPVQSRLILNNCAAQIQLEDRNFESCLCTWEEIQTDTVSYVVYDTTHIWIDSVRVAEAIYDPEKLKLYSIPTFSCSEPITNTGPFTWVLSQPIVVPDSAQLWNLIILEKAINLADSSDCQSSKWRIQNKYSITPRETQNWQSGKHSVVNGKFEIWIR